MDYDLIRVDYTLSGVTYPDTMKILPSPGLKMQQRFAIGDKNGVLQLLSIKDEEPTILFKTLPGKPITSVQLAVGPGSQGDKIFAASGNEVKGYTRKGKVFLTLETTLSETITCMGIVGGDLVLGSGRVVTHFRDLKEFHSYTCEDRILDLAVFCAPNSTKMRLLVLIANKGAVLLESGETISKVNVTSGPTRLLVPPNQHVSDVQAFYGAADGSLGIIAYNSVELTSKCLLAGGGLGPVVCCGWWLTSTSSHLLVGRQDGSVQLYLVDMDNLYDTPKLKFTYFCGEPITSVAGGCVGTDEGEVLAATFSGRVFALRQRHLAAGTLSINNMSQEALTARRNKLESEIIRLEKQTAAERDKYQRSTRALHGGLSAPPLLDIHSELSGATREGWQEIRITSAIPLDMVFVYCGTKLEVVTDSASVLSVCPSQGSLSDLLATIRCQAGTRRLWLRVRFPGPQPSFSPADSPLMMYALPAGAPRVARLISLRLPYLPYYSEHVDYEIGEKENRVWSEMSVSGGFSVAEISWWLAECLPGELPRPAHTVAFARRHTLLQTLLLCKYMRNSATFKSDNISTIAALKEFILNCSVRRNIQLDISCNVPENMLLNAFEKIEELFCKEFTINHDLKLLKSMSALDLDSEVNKVDLLPLCEEYLRIWNKSSSSHEESCFDELVETIEQWYKDFRILCMQMVGSPNVGAQLKSALQSCNIEDIKEILQYLNERPESNQL